MERFVELAKPDFIGRAAAAREAEAGPRLRRVSLAIEADDADVMGDEPIWARVDRDWGAVAAAARLRRAALRRRRRRAAEGRRPPRRRLAGRRLGHLRRLRPLGRLSLAQGYLPAGAGRARRGRASSRSRSSACAARRASLLEPPFDPDGQRMRA